MMIANWMAINAQAKLMKIVKKRRIRPHVLPWQIRQTVRKTQSASLTLHARQNELDYTNVSLYVSHSPFKTISPFLTNFEEIIGIFLVKILQNQSQMYTRYDLFVKSQK